jgi:biopolymer transport protein ExbD
VASFPTGRGDSEPIAEMNVIPFIDICLVLLIIVLVTATFSTQLLDFSHPRAARTEFVGHGEALVVEVAADGRCAVGGRTVDVAALGAEIGALGPSDVVLRAGPKVPSHRVVAAVDEIKAVAKGRLAFAVSE